MKQKTKLIISIVFWSVLALGFLYLTLADFASGKDSGAELVKNVILLLVVVFAGIYRNVHKLKFLGRYDPDAEDERDQIIEQKTNSQVLNILEYVLLIGGAICLIAAGLVKNDYQMTALLFVGVALEAVWLLDLILIAVISAINYHKN